MIGHGGQQAIAEGMTLGVKAGVETQALWECVRRGALGRMSYLHERLPLIVFRGQYDPPQFALALARKDIGLATELAGHGEPADLAPRILTRARENSRDDDASLIVVRIAQL